MNDYEALLHQAERLEALQEIRNLMGRYSYLHSAFRNKEYAELWAKREDDKLVMPFGKFVGWEAVRHCYVDLHGDRNNPDDIDELQRIDDDSFNEYRDYRSRSRWKNGKRCLVVTGYRNSTAAWQRKGRMVLGKI